MFLLEKFHQYAYSIKTEIHTDYKPLEAIVKKLFVKVSKCLQIVLLCTQKYDTHVKSVKGFISFHFFFFCLIAYQPSWVI